MAAKPRKNGYKVEGKGKWDGKNLTSMRETAFGKKAYFETKEILFRAECMRDDEALLKAAEEKRKRKLEKIRSLYK